jgi:hypothetical protein
MVDKKRFIGLDFMDFNRRLKRNLFLLLINLLTAIFVLAALTIFLPTISASFLPLGSPNSSIEAIYGASDNITGWINISFNSEPLNSFFNDSRGNYINLSEMLKKNVAYSYSCSPADCKEDYSAANPGQTRTLGLVSGSSKIYGIKLTGDIFSIDSLKFTLESDAPASCINQVEVDILDDSSVDFINKNSMDSETCSSLKNYGCFDATETSEEPVIGTTPYCEKVNLSSSPGFSIGAWIKKISGSRTINASIYNLYGEEVARCALPDASLEGAEVSCSVGYSVAKTTEHYVCIYSTGGSGIYTTKSYDTSNGCGFWGTPVPDTTPAAYQIFAQGKRFGSVGSSEINKSLTDGRSLAEITQEYLTERYNGMNCSLGCVIPLKILSNSNQNLTLKNLEVQYQKGTGTIIEKNFYEISKTPAKITSGFQKLYLDNAGFSVPNSLGNYSFSLKFNNHNVITKKVEVKDVPIIKSVIPIFAAAAYPTEFAVNVDSKNNLTSFSWDFGDNTTEITTNKNKTTHSYSEIGVYNLKILVIDKKNLSSSKTFVINVSSSKDLINSNLNKMKKDISDLEKEISSLEPFYQQALNSSLNLSYASERINSLREEYTSATTESEYNEIATELISMKIPGGITKSGSAEGVTLMPGPDYVNLEAVKEIGNKSYSSGEEAGYINGILFWQRENLNINLNYNEFSGRYEGYIEPITRIFEINIEKKKDIPYDYYLIMPELQGFETDSTFNIKSGYVYISLRNKNSVAFSTTEDFDPTNLPAFISPAISQLSVVEGTLPEEKTLSKWVIFGLVIFFLLVIAFVTYIILQEWYKRRYENYLFKNRNDLYNMINYLNNAKKKGLGNRQIEENLKKAGWSSERITYVMKKYAGKRTGMLEIPIIKAAEKAGGNPKSPG